MLRVLLPIVLVIGLGLVVALWVWAGLIPGLITLTVVCIVVGLVVDRDRRNRPGGTPGY
jgi:CHASE2 domain-containing sensor protein